MQRLLLTDELREAREQLEQPHSADEHTLGSGIREAGGAQHPFSAFFVDSALSRGLGKRDALAGHSEHVPQRQRLKLSRVLGGENLFGRRPTLEEKLEQLQPRLGTR